jgi:hypothetical protein
MPNFIVHTYEVWDIETRSFRHLMDASFTIGDGEPIASDGLCIVQVLATDPDKPSTTTATGPHRYTWHIPEQKAQHYADMTDVMTEDEKPGDQYIDIMQPQTIVALISTGEYDAATIRDMRATNPAGPSSLKSRRRPGDATTRHAAYANAGAFAV